MPPKVLATKFSVGQLFLGFHTVLIVGVGGTLGVMLATASDLYSPLSTDILNISLISIAWFAAILAFVGMIFCLHQMRRLENIVACLVVFCFFELVFFGFTTMHVFTSPLRSHRGEERAHLVKMVMEINQNATAMRKGDFSLDNAYLKGRILVLQYKSDGNGGYYKAAMRKSLTDEACGYLAKYSLPDVLSSVAYIFSVNKSRDTFAFNSKDCGASEKDTAVVPGSTMQNEKDSVASPVTSAVAIAVPSGSAQQPSGVKNQMQDQPSTNADIESLTARVDRLQESLNRLHQQLDQLSTTAPSVSGYATSSSVKAMEERLDKCERQIEASRAPAGLVAPGVPLENSPLTQQSQ